MSYPKLAKQYLRQVNSEVGLKFVEISDSEIPFAKCRSIKAWRNKHFLVQLFEDSGTLRLSVNRTDVKGFRSDNSPVWKDGISWDELQDIKTQVGYGDRWAVELFPPNSEVVNVSNMRHLWLLPEPPAFGWHGGRDVKH